MKLVAREIDLGSRSPTVLLNIADATELGVHQLDRVQIEHDGRLSIGIVEFTEELVDPGTLGVTRRLGHLVGSVDVIPAPQPTAVHYIKKKLNDVELEKHELQRIVLDIKQDRLSDVELGAYVTATYTNGLSLAETMHLAECMADVGDAIQWDDAVVADKHSIGGVAGNRVTPIVVSIVAAAGVKIPKTSSRAVTSPAGTADTMEVLCDVAFSLEEIEQIVTETNGCLVWGGSVNLSPVDDKIIRAETPLSIDPPGQIIASVLSKKKSAGSTHIVVDIPYGEGAKVESLAAARELAQDFKRVGDHLGMTIECTITRGSQPIGRGVGPILEARDVLDTLAGNGPEELRLKSLRLADILLGSCGCESEAAEILDSGRALAKFREIVAAQGGNPDVTADDLVPGRHELLVAADRDGVVTHVDNRLVSDVARRAGAPKDKGAGITLHCRVGDEIHTDDPLFTVHAESKDKLADAERLVDQSETVRVRSRDEALVERV
ncbi:AMP phosphorylase [Halogranum rubrum]|uniref:AMP phosphorylase n=1 Tax=Halogranum salarium B-1 TaxID=1210908 RepID=J3JGJ9_9EURY|nr:AMP phosphorylase [Halogranum salarium]EJN60199.1 amp phosphorylase [Halogranum salarium B-1]